MPRGKASDHPLDWPATRRWFWTSSQRRGLSAIVLFACAGLGLTFVERDATLADPPPPIGPLAHALADRIDPNVASAERLGALPGIGPSKAAAIVADREAAGRFENAADLARVHGIGSATVAKLRPHLVFPSGN